jgi:lipopolysaccharide export system permease protein
MISILDRYIGRSIFTTSLMVLSVLLALTSVFAFIGELDDVGREQYTILTAAIYIALRLPASAYELFAPAVLLGSLLGLGTMATHSELIVMRAAGISIQRVIRSVLLVGVLLMIVVAIIGEYIAPKAEQYAQTIRLSALSKKVSVGIDSGLWLKSSDLFINVKTVMPDRALLNISVYKFEANKLKYAMLAKRAIQTEDKKWLLQDISYTHFNDSGVSVKRLEEEVRDELVSSAFLNNLSVDPETMSAQNLMKQVSYMNKNNLDSDRIQHALWTKHQEPLATILMKK